MSMCAAMSEMKTWEFWRAVLAECLGMIILVFIGLSAAIGDQNNSYPDHEIKVAFAFGLAVATLAQCIGHVSGAHLNPAITVGLLASCHMSLLGAIFYMIAQILGAVAGSAIVYGIRPETTHSLGVNKVRWHPCVSNFPVIPPLNEWQALLSVEWHLGNCPQAWSSFLMESRHSLSKSFVL